MATDIDDIWAQIDAEFRGASAHVPCPQMRTVDGAVVEVCSRCKSTEVTLDNGLIECQACGHGEESIVFEAGAMGHTGVTRPARLYVAGNGRTTAERQHRNISSAYRDKTLETMCRSLREAGEMARVSQRVLDVACTYVEQLFARSGEGSKYRSGNRDGLLAACLFYAFDKLGAYRAVWEVARIMNVNAHDIHRGLRHFMKLLPEAEVVQEYQVPRPRDFVYRWVSNLVQTNPKFQKDPKKYDCVFANRVSERCCQILDLLESKPIKNKPEARAAGCIWWILENLGITRDLRITKVDLKAVCNTSEATILNAYQEIKAHIVVQQ